MYFHAELVQLIVSQSNSELEVQRLGMKKNTFDCWSCHVGWWTVNETTWKPSQNRRSRFFENHTAETEFLVFEFWGQFASVRFLENIFIGFHKPQFLLIMRCVPNVAKRSTWEQCIYWGPTTDQPTTDWPHILENFEWPYLGNGSSNPLHVWF